MRAAATSPLLAFALLLGACDTRETTLPFGGDPGTIHLTPTQAAALVSRVTLLAPVHAELAWLADSVSLVLKAGAQADRVDITTDLAPGPFYAVGLQRAITTSTNSAATFDLIAFNDPSNPTAFIIVDGFRSVVATQPPTSVTGTFGATTSNGIVSGHLFHVTGGVVAAWRAEAGVATMNTGTPGAACVDFPLTGGVTCAQTSLHSSFSITMARHDNGAQPNDTRSATLPLTRVAGVLLRFQFP